MHEAGSFLIAIAAAILASFAKGEEISETNWLVWNSESSLLAMTVVRNDELQASRRRRPSALVLLSKDGHWKWPLEWPDKEKR